MIRAYLLLLVLASSAVAIVSLFRALPLALILFPLGAGLLCLGLGGAIGWAALSVPTDRTVGLLVAGSVLLVAALNLGAAAMALIRRR